MQRRLVSFWFAMTSWKLVGWFGITPALHLWHNHQLKMWYFQCLVVPGKVRKLVKYLVRHNHGILNDIIIIKYSMAYWRKLCSLTCMCIFSSAWSHWNSVDHVWWKVLRQKKCRLQLLFSLGKKEVWWLFIDPQQGLNKQVCKPQSVSPYFYR